MTSQPYEPPVDWRLFVSSDTLTLIGGYGTVFGSAGAETIRVLDEPGYITFDPSFNRGGDYIQLSGAVSDWQIIRLGSSASLTDGKTTLVLPVGTAGTAIGFEDSARILIYDPVAETMKIGAQSFGAALETIEAAPAESPLLPDAIDPDAMGRLALAPGGTVTVGGNHAILGTADHEQVHLKQGRFELDASFNRGGDTVTLDAAIQELAIARVGSSVKLTGAGYDVTIPVGTEGMTLEFEGASATLIYDPASQQIMLGGAAIDFQVPPLTFA